MAIKDLREEFCTAGHGHLTLDVGGLTFDYVDGPNGEREHQLLRFAGGYAPKNRKFVINPKAGSDGDAINRGDLILQMDPVPPMGDLLKACRDAAKLVLDAFDHAA